MSTSAEWRARELARLRENEFDLQTELTDLADEIDSRVICIGAVLSQLADVRRQIRGLVGVETLRTL